MNLSKALRGLAIVATVLALSTARAGEQPAPGFLVVAQDRGYMGNEEARAAFARIDVEGKALVFITDEDSRKYLDTALAELREAGAASLAVLPYYLSAQHPGWQMARSWLEEEACAEPGSCAFSRPFGRSYFAVDLLDRALAGIDAPERKALVVIGSGADDDESAQRMAPDWQYLAKSTDAASGFDSVAALVWDRRGREEQIGRLKELAGEGSAVIVGYHLGWKLDGMMSLDAMLRHRVAGDVGADVVIATIPSETAGTWMQREVNRNLIRDPRDVGVVIQAHGATFHWNETMRNAVAPLHGKYAVEYAFSMADRTTIEVALRRLEERGLRAAVVVRVFGREDSFRDTIEKQLGIDFEAREPGERHDGHHGGGHMMMASGRIHTPLVLASAGGLGDHPMFAEGLLARVMEISENPARETVILVAHGVGDDEVNDRWLGLLESLARQMSALGGDAFRAIRFATWREDWPEKRGPWIAKVRAMVGEAQADGGRALVIPARTNSGGPEDEFLEGLDYRLGKGFAPHPLFTKWVDAKVQDGIAQLKESGSRRPVHRLDDGRQVPDRAKSVRHVPDYVE